MSKTSFSVLEELRENSRKVNSLISDFGINAKFLLELGGKYLFGQLQEEDVPALKACVCGVSEFLEEINSRIGSESLEKKPSDAAAV